MTDLTRLAINQATTRAQWTLRQAIEGYARQGIRRIAVWRDKLAACGMREAKRLLEDHGMTVTGYNRVGPMFGVGSEIKPTSPDDDLQAIEEAAELGAACVLVFTGGMTPGTKDIAGMRANVLKRIAALLPAARRAGVALAIEPLHPMFAADRSFINTMEHANELCDALGQGVGIVVDVYHVWWDPHLSDQIKRAGADRLLGFHICDWLIPTRSFFSDRGMMGDGVIDIPLIRSWLDHVGYRGAIEVEIFSTDWWARNPDEVVTTCIERYRNSV